MCGNTGFSITVRNNCGESVLGQICIRQLNGRCSCGARTVRAGDSWSYYACDANGPSITIAGPVGSPSGCFPDRCD